MEIFLANAKQAKPIPLIWCNHEPLHYAQVSAAMKKIPHTICHLPDENLPNFLME